MSRQPKSIAAISDEILAEVEREDRVKTAEVTAVQTAALQPTEIGQLLHKVAEELRIASVDVSYDDVRKYLESAQ